MNDRKDKNRRIIYVKLCKEMRNVFCPINRDESTGWLMSAQCESLRLRKDGQEHREECSIYALWLHSAEPSSLGWSRTSFLAVAAWAILRLQHIMRNHHSVRHVFLSKSSKLPLLNTMNLPCSISEPQEYLNRIIQQSNSTDGSTCATWLGSSLSLKPSQILLLLLQYVTMNASIPFR